MKIFCYLVSVLKFSAWFFTFVLMMVVYLALKDLAGLNIFRFKEPDKYPTQDLTAFLLDPPGACADVRKYNALMVVHSATAHFRQRRDYRNTYGNGNFTEPYRIKVLFFLGLPTDPGLQAQVTKEHMHHKDIVQSGFVDTYHNLSYKAVAVLRWLTEKCLDPQIIIKMDDDVLLDVHRFFEEFVPPPSYQHDVTVQCHMWEAAEADRRGKWRLSRRQYALDTFPDYCSGFLVLLMMPAVEELYYMSLETPMLWVDDVYIYGLVRKKTKEVQVLFLDQVSHSEEKYNRCVRLYGYRCKYWATTLSVSPQSSLVPSLLFLRSERLRTQREMGMATRGGGGGGAAGEWGSGGAAGRDRGQRCPFGVCRLRRRREMERMRLGGTKTLS